MKLILACTLALTLTACASNGEKGISAAEGALLSCETAARTIVQLTPYRAQGKLSAGQVEIVDKALAITEPYCTGPAPNVDSDLKDVAIDAGARMLQGVLLAVLN